MPIESVTLPPGNYVIGDPDYLGNGNMDLTPIFIPVVTAYSMITSIITTSLIPHE